MMCKKMSCTLMLVVAMSVSAVAFAAGVPKKVEPVKVINNKADQIKIALSFKTGLGYDSNAFNSPNKTYVDYAAIPTGSNPTVTARARSGFFVPYNAEFEAEKRIDRKLLVVGSTIVDGNYYLGGLGNANEFNLALNGGVEFALANWSATDIQLYAGAIVERHNKMYVDHDTGASKTNSGGIDVSNRYNFSSKGVEAKCKQDFGNFAYTIKGKRLINDYPNPVVVAQMDNTFSSLGVDTELNLREGTKLKLSAEHSTRNYSFSHARKSNGVYSTATTPLLSYTYNDYGVTVRQRMSGELVAYLDYDYSKRIDGYVNYNNYNLQRFGGRVLYEQDQLKGKLSLHHWNRDYPNAFAYDVAGQPGKVYSGNDLKLKAEFALAKTLSLWAEAIHTLQNSSDLRYDYNQNQIMAGVNWDL